MTNFSFLKTDLEGAFLITSFLSEDNRGTFIKYFEKDVFAENAILFNCSESFISHSIKNVIRGLHFQIHNPQAKIVGVINGKVYDVIVDLRKNSSTFGKWSGFYLSSENKNSLYIPSGFAHGFISLSDDSIVSYQCDGKYDKETDTGIKFDDTDIRVEWPILDLNQAIVSTRDRNLLSMSEFKYSYGGL